MEPQLRHHKKASVSVNTEISWYHFVSKRELTNIEVPTAKSRVSMIRELFGKRVWVSTSPFHVSLSRSD